MHPIFRRTTTLATALLTAGLLAACASHAPLPALEQARSSVERASTDAAVGQYAQIELKEARDTLARADRVWTSDKDESEANHLAYLAQQRADIASNTARARQLDAQIQQAGSETDRLRLQARTREADQATQRAQQEARNAQLAQQQAMSAEQRAAQQQAAARSAQERVSALEAQQTERGLLVTLGDVLFAFDKAELSAQAAPRLDKLARFLAQFPERKMLIEGYTDSVGSDAYNLSLSERRAQAVRDALVQRGVDSARITARGYGKVHPVADNGSADGRAVNRRVEIVIADEKGNLRGR